MTVIFFAAFYSFFSGKRAGKYAWFYAVFRLLPRLVVGAHWISDIVASGMIVLFLLSWTLFTPFHRRVIDNIEEMLLSLKKNLDQKNFKN